jgi:hypothetical protein
MAGYYSHKTFDKNNFSVKLLPSPEKRSFRDKVKKEMELCRGSMHRDLSFQSTYAG